MQNTTNLNLKKPEYTDFADIQDINDNMDILDDALHDTQNSVATFTSSDVADGSATSWTTVTKVDSGETHKSIFAKMSQMFKNIRFLYKMLGTTDISSIGNGTVTNALSVLNANKYPIDLPAYEITANSNLNNYTSLGKYQCNDTNIVQTLVNRPTDLAFYMIVENGMSNGYIIQTVYTASEFTCPTFKRIRRDGVWGPWNSMDIVANDDLNAKTVIGTHICNSSSVASSVIHAPGSGPFVMDIRQGMSVGYIVQTVYYFANASIPIYMRVRISGTWSAWVKIN